MPKFLIMFRPRGWSGIGYSTGMLMMKARMVTTERYLVQKQQPTDLVIQIVHCILTSRVVVDGGQPKIEL